MLIPDKNNKNVKKQQCIIPRVGPTGKPDLTKDQIKEIKIALQNSNVTFFIVANQNLKELMSRGTSPLVSGISSLIRLPLLEGKGILISTKMVIEWIEGKLDLKNSLILNNSDIRIIEQGNFKIGENDG